jgi:hypothetical protein
VIRRAHDLLTEWSEEYQEDVDNEDDDVADDAKTPPAAGQEDDYIRAVIAVLRVAEPLGKRAILEQAVIPESRWPRVIKLLKSRGMIEQSGNRSSTTYRLVNGEV